MGGLDDVRTTLSVSQLAAYTEKTAGVAAAGGGCDVNSGSVYAAMSTLFNTEKKNYEGLWWTYNYGGAGNIINITVGSGDYYDTGLCSGPIQVNYGIGPVVAGKDIGFGANVNIRCDFTNIAKDISKIFGKRH